MLRRGLRHAFTTVSACSLLLFIATCVLWVRSYRTWDRVERYRLEPGGPNVLNGIGTGWPGTINYGRVQLDDPSKQRWPRTSKPWHWVHEPRPPMGQYQRKWSFLGFEAWDLPVHPTNGGGRVRGFQIPMWSLVLPFGILSTPVLMRARRWRRARRRRRAGQCPTCGYDLRASPETCPECGRPAQNPA